MTDLLPGNVVSVSEKEESDILDFKCTFDPICPADWCELVKDVIAMANSGGGRIVIGVKDDGTPSGYDVSTFRGIDTADIVNKIHKYTEQQFADYRVDAGEIDGYPVAVLVVGGIRFPIIFTAPGEYEIPSGKHKSAFRVGTVYFRHGAKSEPGTTEDLRNTLERELARLKAFWLDGITKVVEAPEGSEIRVVNSVSSSYVSADTPPIHLTNSSRAPEFKVIDYDKVYPYRSKELIMKLADLLGPNVVNSHDILQVRRAHEIDSNPNFSHKGRFGTRQYSGAFVTWLLDKYAQDPKFFQMARADAKAKRSAHN